MKTLPRLLFGIAVDAISCALILISYFALNKNFAFFSFGVAFILIFFAISLYNNPTKKNSNKIIKFQHCISIADVFLFFFSVVLFSNNLNFYINFALVILFIISTAIIACLLFKEYALCENVDSEQIDTKLRLNANVKAVLSIILIICIYIAIFIMGFNFYLFCLLPIVVLSFYLSYQRLIYSNVFCKKQIIKYLIFDNVFVAIGIILCVIFTESNLLFNDGEINIGFNIIIFIVGILLLIPTFLTNAKIIKKNAYLKNHLGE